LKPGPEGRKGKEEELLDRGRRTGFGEIQV
jgi:hypothetical protein